MKKLILYMMLIFPCSLMAQIGIKGGINFANVTQVDDISNSNQSGFHAGIFLAPPSKGIIGSRTELLYSRQGYNYKTGTNTGNVNLDYIMLPQYMSINITKFFSIQFGGQIGYLINAKADSTADDGSTDPYGGIMDMYNRFDYGYGGGIEIHPVSGLVIGGRFNISLSSLYDPSAYTSGSGNPADFVPKVDVKNNLFQIFAGWRFGKQPKKEKKDDN